MSNRTTSDTGNERTDKRSTGQRTTRRRMLTASGGAIGLAGLVNGTGTARADEEQSTTTDNENACEHPRRLHVQATELDARRSTEDTPFPQQTREEYEEYFGPADEPFTREGQPGYYLFMTEEDEWRVGSYQFLPSEAIAYKGEDLALEVLGVRGDSHATVLEDPTGGPVVGPDGEEIEFTVNRGGLEVIEFTVDQTGLYQLICYDHLPTMIMNIHVLPRY